LPALHKLAAILIGSLLIAVGINFFLMPFKVLDGGVIGIALIINYLFGVKVGLVMFLCSIPIFALAWFHHRSMLFDSVQGLICSTFAIDLLEPYHYYFLYYFEFAPFTSSVFGGFLVGTGIGIMLRFKTSTGGTDLLAQFMTRLVSVNVGILVFAIDAIVISMGGLLISAETFLLSIVTITAGGIATSLVTSK
jgi:uncharacterized membrane-anchored protein YitT (DUF2179 family)